jgi:hypothetical protein
VIAARSVRWAAVAAAVLLAPAPRALAEARPLLVVLDVVGAPAVVKATRDVLADLLARIAIEVAAESPPDRRPLARVVIDLSSGPGAPSVTLTVGPPWTIISRRALDAGAPREVLIESAAEVAYLAVQTRARAVGVLPADAGGAVPPDDPAAPGPEAATRAGAQTTTATEATAATAATTMIARSETGDAVAAPVPPSAPRPSFGIDVGVLAALQTRSFASGSFTAGGAGGALTIGLRRSRLGPALTLAAAYLQPLTAADPYGPPNPTIVSTRVTPTVRLVCARWLAVQLGPALMLDALNTPAPGPSMPGPPMGGPGPSPGGPPPAAGMATWTLQVSAGAEAQAIVRITGRAHAFLAGSAGLRLSGGGNPRSGGQPGPGGYPAPSASRWSSSFLAGLSFTMAGRTPTAD